MGRAAASEVIPLCLLLCGANAGPGLPVTADETDECAGWLNGTRPTYLDESIDKGRKFHHSLLGGFTSQYRQDKQMWLNLFRHTHRNQKGTYADVAANHFKRISNTYFYDRCLGWRGLCVEPNPAYHDDLRTRRSCELIPRCASNRTDPVDLAWPQRYRDQTDWVASFGGITSTLRKASKATDTASATEGATAGWIHQQMSCVKVGAELEQRGWTQIDFLSLDVECVNMILTRTPGRRDRARGLA